jgi:hypothetical protein
MDFYTASAQPWVSMDPALPKFHANGYQTVFSVNDCLKTRVESSLSGTIRPVLTDWPFEEFIYLCVPFEGLPQAKGMSSANIPRHSGL